MSEVFERVMNPDISDMPVVYEYADHAHREGWEEYYKQLDDEWRQCVGEGLDVEPLKPVFDAVKALPDGAFKALAADRLYKEIIALPVKAGFEFIEPSSLEEIKAARPKANRGRKAYDAGKLKDKLEGAWYGRICGCILGKALEGIRTDELIPFLKETGNFPMHRYVLSSDVTKELQARYRYGFHCFADEIQYALADDDTNYTCLYQWLIKHYGREFTPDKVLATWQIEQPKTAYCTAERVAYCNSLKGLRADKTAIFENPYREWIGAQIRADYFGYINPGNPELAAEMAWRDASISHVKNGIYGEMFVAAMIAEAAVETDLLKIIKAGLNEIPEKCRLQKEINDLLDKFAAGESEENVFAWIHTVYDETTAYGWCHTNSNALIVCASMLYKNGDYSASICRAVQTGFDTDCNGATVGSILGMRGGSAVVGPEWKDRIHGTLETTIIGVGNVSIEKLVNDTLEDVE